MQEDLKRFFVRMEKRRRRGGRGGGGWCVCETTTLAGLLVAGRRRRMDRYHHHYRRRHHSRAKSRPTTAAVPTSPQHRNTSLPLSTLTPTAAPNLQRKTKGRVQRSGRSHLPRSACRQRRISTTPVRRTRVRGQGHPSALAPGPAPDRGSPGALRDGGLCV